MPNHVDPGARTKPIWKSSGAQVWSWASPEVHGREGAWQRGCWHRLYPLIPTLHLFMAERGCDRWTLTGGYTCGKAGKELVANTYRFTGAWKGRLNSYWHQPVQRVSQQREILQVAGQFPLFPLCPPSSERAATQFCSAGSPGSGCVQGEATATSLPQLTRRWQQGQHTRAALLALSNSKLNITFQPILLWHFEGAEQAQGSSSCGFRLHIVTKRKKRKKKIKG